MSRHHGPDDSSLPQRHLVNPRPALEGEARCLALQGGAFETSGPGGRPNDPMEASHPELRDRCTHVYRVVTSEVAGRAAEDHKLSEFKECFFSSNSRTLIPS